MLADYVKRVKRIVRLIKADRAGRAIVSPCKIGDKVERYGYSFTVERIEMGKEFDKHGLLFRCGNAGTEDYMAFFEDEIGERILLLEGK